MNKYRDTVNAIENRLDALTAYDPCSYELLLQAERYSLTAGGKHLRALILIETARLGGCPAEAVIDFACAVEMVHTYSLIHDDLPEMDNDDLRRGKPTCHIQFGSDVALLAGDALLTKAFSLIAADTHFDSNAKIECIKILSDACGEHGMLAGQMIDKLCEKKQASRQLLTELNDRKTGDMFVAALRMGCVLSGLSLETEDALVSGMRALGRAFQIKDDILDVSSNEQTLGKPIHSDDDNHKSTFVSVYGLDASSALLAALITDAKTSFAKVNAPFFVELSDYFINRNR